MRLDHGHGHRAVGLRQQPEQGRSRRMAGRGAWPCREDPAPGPLPEAGRYRAGEEDAVVQPLPAAASQVGSDSGVGEAARQDLAPGDHTVLPGDELGVQSSVEAHRASAPLPTPEAGGSPRPVDRWTAG